jgi:5-methylcytosine-specific restriction endonuclease McrA
MERKTRTQRGYGAQWEKLCERAYALYGYHCYYCNQPIIQGLPKTHRLSRTVDHLNPIVFHGTALPSIDDVRPMHRSCNTRRRNDVARQQKPKQTTASRRW